jgi:hypothetical protein
MLLEKDTILLAMELKQKKKCFKVKINYLNAVITNEVLVK